MIDSKHKTFKRSCVETMCSLQLRHIDINSKNTSKTPSKAHGFLSSKWDHVRLLCVQ